MEWAAASPASAMRRLIPTSTPALSLTNSNNDDVAFVLGTTNSFTSLNYNLTGGGSGNTAFTGSGDRRGIFTPLLGPLAYNGGLTQTRALLLGSLAINGGDPAAVAGVNVPVDDQRGTGFSRIFGGRIDIGAFEFQSALPAQNLVVNTIVDELDGNYGAGDLSLREALKIANDNFGVVDTITFALSPVSILKLTQGELGDHRRREHPWPRSGERHHRRLGQ